MKTYAIAAGAGVLSAAFFNISAKEVKRLTHLCADITTCIGIASLITMPTSSITEFTATSLSYDSVARASSLASKVSRHGSTFFLAAYLTTALLEVLRLKKEAEIRNNYVRRQTEII